MSEITFEDIVDAKRALLSDGKTPTLVRATDDAIGGLKGDTRVVSSTEYVSEADVEVGVLNGMTVFEADRNVLVAEDGTEVSLD